MKNHPIKVWFSNWRNQKRSICWKFQLSISLGRQKSPSTIQSGLKLNKPFWNRKQKTKSNLDIKPKKNFQIHDSTARWIYRQIYLIKVQVFWEGHKNLIFININSKYNLISMFAKGQIIWKANFEVFIWTKNRTKIFLYFWPSKMDQIKKRIQIIILDDK